jgi:hypothetical protein
MTAKGGLRVSPAGQFCWESYRLNPVQTMPSPYSYHLLSFPRSVFLWTDLKSAYFALITTADTTTCARIQSGPVLAAASGDVQSRRFTGALIRMKRSVRDRTPSMNKKFYIGYQEKLSKSLNFELLILVQILHISGRMEGLQRAWFSRSLSWKSLVLGGPVLSPSLKVCILKMWATVNQRAIYVVVQFNSQYTQRTTIKTSLYWHSSTLTIDILLPIFTLTHRWYHRTAHRCCDH